MNERRGLGQWNEHRRFVEYCSNCQQSTAHEMREENGKSYLFCMGESRGPNPRPPCGTKLAYHPSRLYGECFHCRQVRRAFKAPNGKAYCVYCCQEVSDAKEYHDGVVKPSIDQ